MRATNLKNKKKTTKELHFWSCEQVNRDWKIEIPKGTSRIFFQPIIILNFNLPGEYGEGRGK